MSLGVFEETLKLWVAPGISAAIALTVVAIGYRIGLAVLRRLTRSRPVPAVFVRRAADPGLVVAALIALEFVLQSTPDTLPWVNVLRHLAALLLIAAVSWLVVCLTVAIAEAVAVHYPANVEDNLNARRIQTQTRLLTRSLASIVVVVGISFALLTFPGVRNIGASLLASAGIAGLVAGIAARPILGNLLAGLQIALTQPVRLDDVVIIEGEWGRIEEITRTYVVVAIWDQRRLIVPLQQIIEKPFQNWTRATSEILGTVFLWVDYGTPIEPLRAELKRICEQAPEWDRRLCLIQVTDATEQAVQLRALVSSADASRNWDLRCLVRERLLEFLQREYPDSLPRLRATLTPDGVPAAPAPVEGAEQDLRPNAAPALIPARAR